MNVKKSPTRSLQMINNLKNKENIQLLLVSIFIFSLNTYWIYSYRRSGILDIDEAGYLTMAWNNWNSFASEGVLGFLQSVVNQPLHAPLQPAFTALLFTPLGPKIIFGLITPSIFYVGVFILVYKILRKSYRNFESIYLSFFISQLNLLVAYSRNYNFAISTTFFVLLSTYLIIFVKNLSKFQNILLGLSLGGIILARTMSVIYLPFLILIYLVIQILEKRKKIEIFKSLLITLCSLLIISFPWFSQNFKSVFNYLTSYGYGNNANEYGNENFLLSLENLKFHIFNLSIYQYSISTVTVLVIIPVLTTLVKVLKDRQVYLPSIKVSKKAIEITSLILLIIGVTLVLMSSKNKGSGFDLPIIVLFHILFLLLFKFTPSKLNHGVILIIVFFQIFIFMGQPTQESHYNRRIQIPFTQLFIPVTPENNISVAYLKGGLNGEELSPKENIEFSWLRTGIDANFRWNSVKVDIIRFLEQTGTDSQFVLMTTRHRIVNPNSINLIRAQENKPLIPFRFLPAQEISESGEIKSLELLNNEFSVKPCTVIQSTGSINEILPKTLDQEIMEQIRKRGYILRNSIAMPDYRIIRIYQSREYCVNQLSPNRGQQ